MRVGRGNGSGRGNTSGKGNGGHNKRPGQNNKQHFLMTKQWKKSPKFGIKPKKRNKYHVITGQAIKNYLVGKENITNFDINKALKIPKCLNNKPVKIIGLTADIIGNITITGNYFTSKQTNKESSDTQ